MARLNGQSTTNLSVPKLGPKDDLDKSTFNELIDSFDARINIVADESGALLAHTEETEDVHGIVDTSDLVVSADIEDFIATADTPADGDILKYTTALGVHWAAP